jgi:hypothetical protein
VLESTRGSTRAQLSMAAATVNVETRRRRVKLSSTRWLSLATRERHGVV